MRGRSIERLTSYYPASLIGPFCSRIWARRGLEVWIKFRSMTLYEPNRIYTPSFEPTGHELGEICTSNYLTPVELFFTSGY